MNDVNKKLQEFLSDPQVKAVQEELKQYTDDQFKEFDNRDFVGSDLGGFVEAHYVYARRGFCKISISPDAMDDKDFLEGCIASAVNNAMKQYSEEYKAVTQRVYDKETELYNKLIDLAKDAAQQVTGGKTVEKEADVVSLFSPKTKNKTYLN